MHFGFSDDQLAVRDAVGSLLEKQCDVIALQSAWAAGSAQPLRGLWSELAAMGVQGLLVPESDGGSGFDWVTLALVLAETGRFALPLPVMETAAVAVPLIVAAGDPSGVLPGLLDGRLVATVAPAGGRDGPIAPGAGIADLFITGEMDGAAIYRREEVSLSPVASVDRTRDLATVHPQAGGIALGSVDELGALGSAAQLIGLGRELVRMTVDYVKERKQFGVPVGSFQAVKHHLADATLQVEFAAPAVWAAAHLADIGAPDRGRAVSMAKAMASDASSLAARVALQCHGAMGYAAEYHLHLWLKRVWCLAAAYGSASWHRERVAEELGL